MNKSKRQEHLATEAADWVIALADADRATKAAFADWLRESPENISEFLAVSAIWSALPDLDSQPSVDELVRMATAQPNVVRLSGADRRDASITSTGSDSRARWIGRAAAVLVLTLGAALILRFPSFDQPASVHTTRIGEQSSVPLPDGSLVNLNTRSTIRVAYSDEFRDIRLVDGEALFEAEKDDSRPFRVITDHAVIVAVGTRFNVRADPDEVTVTVVEGTVDVAANRPRTRRGSGAETTGVEPDTSRSVRLRGGQQARIQPRLPPALLEEAKVDRAIAWREHRLIFEALPLRQVIDEFNRYNEPPAVIGDDRLESLPISGVFRSDDRASFLQFLAQMELAESTVNADGSIVLTGASPD